MNVIKLHDSQLDALRTLGIDFEIIDIGKPTIEMGKTKKRVPNLLEYPFKTDMDFYCTTTRSGEVTYSRWYGSLEDMLSYDFGNALLNTPENVNKMKDEAEQKKALVKVNRLVEMLINSDFYGWECDWENSSQPKWYPAFDHESNELFFTKSFSKQFQRLFNHAPIGVWELIDKDLILKAMGLDKN